MESNELSLHQTQCASLAADLCELAERARRDPTRAARHFESELHDPLHVVAQALVASDAALAGDLLRAKAVVEEHIADEATSGDELAEALVTLARQLPGGDACGR